MLINLIEDYNVRLLSTKVFWEDLSKRDEYKKFWDKYQKIAKLKETDFIKDDLKKIHDENNKVDYSKLEVYYKRKLLDYGQIKEIKNSYKSYGKYLGKIRNTVNKLSA